MTYYILGTYGGNSNIHEIFYGEISYGPFHPDPDNHIEKDDLRLGKFGKDGIDQIKKLTHIYDIQIVLIHFFYTKVSFYLMDRKYSLAYHRVFLGSLNMNTTRNFKNPQFFQLSWNIRKLIQRNLDLLKHQVILGEIKNSNMVNNSPKRKKDIEENDDNHCKPFSPKQ
ncbi:16886_t:CDS:2, partial [Entrophospora sp. SA101]